jgi:hypothetical protein
VLPNSGHGTFQPKSDFRVGGAPASVVIGELNRDGMQDLATADSGADGVSVLLNTTNACKVPNVRGKTLSRAKRMLANAHCRPGSVRRAFSKRVKRGHVISQSPHLGAVLPAGGRVNLVVSRGRKR